MPNVLAVAGKELGDDFRNHWAVAIAAIFATLALVITYFGAAVGGHIGFTSFDATIASLTTLAAFVVPLIGLLVAHDAIISEQEGGTLLLLLSYPLSRMELAAGKFLGHSLMLMIAIALGFGGAVLAIEFLTPEAREWTAWSSIMHFLLSASLLGASFVGMACLVSVVAKGKARAAGMALLVWFALVVLFDLLLLAVLVMSGGNQTEQAVYPYLLLLNPIDVFRLINLVGLKAAGGSAFFMAMSGEHSYSRVLLYAVLIAWAAIPFGAACLIFRRKEI